MISWLERRWVRYPLYLFLGIVTFFVALVFAFPGTEIKDIIEVQAEKALKHKYDVDIGDVDLYWLTGLELTDVKIQKVDESQVLDEKMPETIPMKFEIPVVAGRLAIFKSIVNLAPAVQFKVDVGGGTVSGSAVIKKQEILLDASIGPIDLRKTPVITAVLGVPFFGALEGDVDLTIDKLLGAPTKGFANFVGDKITFGPATIKTDKLPAMAFIEVPQTNLGNLELKIAVEKGPDGEASTVIKKCNFAGRDMRGDIWGRIIPTPGSKPELDVEMRIQFDTQYVTKNSLAPLLTISKVSAGKNKDWYGFKLSGRLPKIQFVGDPEVADGPSRPKKEGDTLVGGAAPNAVPDSLNIPDT